MERCFQRAWAGRGLLSFLMLPLALVHALLVLLRQRMYERGHQAVQRINAMVIVVGNVVAGGAGKTPTVIALVQHLGQLGYSVGVISRGYGRKESDIRAVAASSTPDDVGDEPLLIFQRSGVPVWVGGTRAEAALALLKDHPDVQILVCDDGLQHYGLWRDLDICVFDNRGLGNGRVLPAGPLREPWPRKLVSAAGQTPETTLILNTGGHPCMDGFRAVRRLEPFGVNAAGKKYALDQLQTKDALRLYALAGIAQPQTFFDMLKNAGLIIDRTWALPDHFDFRSMDRSKLDGYQVICTEKDAVKLWHFMPQALAVPLTQEFDPLMVKALDDKVRRHFASKLSSPHGNTTT